MRVQVRGDGLGRNAALAFGGEHLEYLFAKGVAGGAWAVVVFVCKHYHIAAGHANATR